jgi:hypothetical protein
MNWQYTVKFPKVSSAVAEDESPKTSIELARAFMPELIRLRDSDYIKTLGSGVVNDITSIVTAFSEVTDMNGFNSAMCDLYDFTDDCRVWVEPWVSYAEEVIITVTEQISGAGSSNG